MITIQHINKTFNSGLASEVKALDDINLTISRGEFVVMIGANGSGKSTLLNILAGNIFADAGTIQINDTDVTKLNDYQRAKWISRIFQNPLQGTSPDLSILDNFRLASLRTKSKTLTVADSRKFSALVKEKLQLLKMGLEDKVDQPMGLLSGGQRQALTLLMAIMDDCKVLLLDEPTAALDPRSAAMVMEKAREIISENHLTAVMVTHHIPDAIKYGTRLIRMNEGTIVDDIASAEKKNLKAEDVYSKFN